MNETVNSKLGAKDLELIGRAEKAQRHATRIVISLTIALLVSLLAFVSGGIDAETMASLSVVLVVFAIVSPLIAGPRYAELVALLVKVRDQSAAEPPDPVVEALRDDR